jgi:hypothetical protein
VSPIRLESPRAKTGIVLELQLLMTAAASVLLSRKLDLVLEVLDRLERGRRHDDLREVRDVARLRLHVQHGHGRVPALSEQAVDAHQRERAEREPRDQAPPPAQDLEVAHDLRRLVGDPLLGPALVARIRRGRRARRPVHYDVEGAHDQKIGMDAPTRTTVVRM